jgi:hypothetical protein
MTTRHARNPVHDPEIRAELHRVLQRRHRRSPTRIVDEMTLNHGSSRIDVAAINGRLEGYEIKSEADSLARLSRQASAYGRIFDRLVLVCAERHLVEARATLPAWWGIEAAEPRGEASTPRLRLVRAPGANPVVEAEALVALLWRPEMLAALVERGRARGLRSAPRRELRAALLEATDERELRRLVRETLGARRGWLARRS